MDELRQADWGDSKLYLCPNGCDKEAMELGTDCESFTAMLGKPYQYIRCGKCGFGDDDRGKPKHDPKLEMADVIAVWNDACVAAFNESTKEQTQ